MKWIKYKHKMYKTGITKVDNKWSVWFKIKGMTFHLESRTGYETAEWMEEQLQYALNQLCINGLPGHNYAEIKEEIKSNE